MQSRYHRVLHTAPEQGGQRLNRATDLIYFTHEVGGRLFGGWYRLAANSHVELYARGQVRKARVGKLTAEKKARRMLEEIVRTLEARATRSNVD